MNHCAQASNLFIKAYSTQETLKAYEDIYQQSNKNLKLIKYKYRKKLITKISYLSSKSDNLNINLLFNSVSKDHKNNIDSLNGILNKPYNPVNLLLKSPESHFGKTFEAGRIEKNSELDSLEELLNSKEMDYKIAKNQSRSDLQIKYQKNISNSQDSLNLEQDDNKVLISWQLPLYNETLRANEQAAWLGKKRALNDLNFAKKNLKTNLKQLSENLRTARENILLSEKKIKILKEQKQESFRLMKSGRFDFQRYVDFRDLYLNEKIAQINRIAQLWVLKSEHLLKTDQISEVCLLGEK